jgi:anti-sigma B factor antagonist
MSKFKIESEAGSMEGVRILRLTGQFTLQHVFDFQAVMRSGTDPVTIIDLTAVPYMDSASLGAIMGAHVFCHRSQRLYALAGVSERIKTLFEVGGVDKLLVVYPTVQEAQLHLTVDKAAANKA